jgi:hypothetical protein
VSAVSSRVAVWPWLLAVALGLASHAGLACATDPAKAVEYYHGGLDHYFVTADAAEAAALDVGKATNGWTRTGQTFTVDTAAGAGQLPVCRFFSAAFAPRSSHFFTADPGECAKVKANSVWQHEGIAFQAGLPTAERCPAGTAPLYRLYNDGRSGAPNHRYTSCPNIGDRMQSLGWIAEGAAMCVAAGSADCSVDDSTGAGVAPAVFRGNIVLGAPTDTSIKVSVFTPDQSGVVTLTYGTAAGTYDRQTAPATIVAGQPLVLALDGLAPDTRYHYRLLFQPSIAAPATGTNEYTFHTARPPGSTFIFTIQADSHLDENSNLDLYRRTLGNVLADAPDFHVDLGDTFMAEKHSEPLDATSPIAGDEATVAARYRYERANFGTLTHSVPLYLVNGNHEGEAGWLNDGTDRNLAVWTTRARQRYFVNPVPDAFYGGDATEEPHVGRRASWYAWHWGDALFIVVDPFWNTRAMVNRDPWVMTLGETQYRWLEATLAASEAKFKFVFIHNLVGGLDGQMRGGVEGTPYFEWGGRSMNGTFDFGRTRPGWSLPIHQLLVRHGVTAVFHGHDHLYARQELDGIVYQEVPQPSTSNYQSGPSLAAAYHYTSGTILGSSGHLRVTVSPERIAVDYVRVWLPALETPMRRNRQVDHSWSVDAR